MLITLITLLATAEAQARPLQIVHTNDLHSHLEHGDELDTGSYAAIKGKIDQLKLEAQIQGIETLVLDAGDFSEGSPFYLANKGTAVWKVMNSMGYDAVTLGNHDWLMGPRDFDWLLGYIRPRFNLLAANYKIDPTQLNMNRYLRPEAEFFFKGMRIAVLGLTTDQFVFSWRTAKKEILDPEMTAAQRVPVLRARNDFVIALTHIGVDEDVSLVNHTTGIDLVVGGHSHTDLHAPLYAQNRDGREVPIVQTGRHGKYIGDLLVDVEPGQPLRVLRYRLIPIHVSDEGRDERMADMVQSAREQFEAEYGRSWLQEVVGHSEVPLERQLGKPNPWSQLVVDSMREAVEADIALDIPQFNGEFQPAGPITREKIITMYPHIFDFEDRFGWTVWSARVKGWMLMAALEATVRLDLVFGISGLTYDVIVKNGKKKVRNVRVGGKKIRPYTEYVMALPEAIARGAVEISELTQLIFEDPVNSRIPIWTAIENKVRRVGTVKKR